MANNGPRRPVKKTVSASQRPGPQTQPKQMSPEQKEAIDKLVQGAANIFKGGGLGGNRKKPYTSVAEALETIGLSPKVMPITIADDPVECLVIPVQELMHKEWSYLTGFTFDTPQTEEQE